MLWVILFCFFFLKQETAYELRISDWSSDVCSSDLRAQTRRHPGVQLLFAHIQHIFLQLHRCNTPLFALESPACRLCKDNCALLAAFFLSLPCAHDSKNRTGREN